MSNEALKKSAAEAAIEYVQADTIVGVGTGSTANYFIDALAGIKNRIKGAVASSEASAQRLRNIGIDVLDLNATGNLPLYVDGADESNERLQLIKGGGGALTREKIVAAASEKFVCIADHSKRVDILGAFPLPIEVIPMARSFIGRELVRMGGDPEYREDFITDNGNIILDVHNLSITEADRLESELNQIPGIVTVGLFALRPADVLIIGAPSGVEVIDPKN